MATTIIPYMTLPGTLSKILGKIKTAATKEYRQVAIAINIWRESRRYNGQTETQYNKQ